MLKKTVVSFPGLGIENFSLDNVAFTLPFGENGFPVMWYGVIIALGMVAAVAYIYYRCKKSENINTDDLMDTAILTILFGIVGARLYYVLFSLDSYNSIWEVFDLRSGGLAIYGGVIAGATTIFVMCKYIKKINWRKFFDATAPGVMIAQAMGRWGNFFNGEAYGSIVEEGNPLYFMRMGLVPNVNSYTTMYYYHPTFLYESLWNVLGFVLINVFYKKKKFDGQIALYYFIWYGFGRMFIEGLRTDSLYLWGTPIRVSQLLGLLLFLAGTGLLIYGLIKTKKDDTLKIEENTNGKNN